MTHHSVCQHLLKLYIAAGGLDTATHRLEKPSRSRYDRVRMRVAENPRTPPYILERLASDNNPDVRVAVATNTSCPPALMQQLACDGDIVVRHGLAQDINTPPEILEQLSEDDNAWVHTEARKTLNILATWTKQQLADKREDMRLRRSSIRQYFSYPATSTQYRCKTDLKSLSPAHIQSAANRRFFAPPRPEPEIACN